MEAVGPSRRFGHPKGRRSSAPQTSISCQSAGPKRHCRRHLLWSQMSQVLQTLGLLEITKELPGVVLLSMT